MSFEAPKSWTRHALHDLATYINGRATKPAEKVSDGVPVIKIADLNRGITASTDRVPAGKVQDKHWVKPGDLLFAWSGTVGIHIYNGPAAALNQHIFRVVAKSGVDQSFLRYLLEGQMAVFERFVADKRTTMGHVTVKDLKATTAPVPPLGEQRRIAGALGALDAKIEANRRTIAALDEFTRRLWLKRFGNACHEGAELRVGWRHGVLSELVDTQYGYTASATSEEVGPRFLRVKDINKQNWIEWSQVPFCPADEAAIRKYGLGLGDIVVARMADPGKAAIIEAETYAVFASYLVRLKVADLASAYFVYGFLKSPFFGAYAASAKGGSVQQNMNARVIVGAPLAIPPSDEMDDHLNEVLPLRQLLNQLLWESERLAEIRDALLPKLVSGKLRVAEDYLADAEEPVVVKV